MILNEVKLEKNEKTKCTKAQSCAALWCCTPLKKMQKVLFSTSTSDLTYLHRKRFLPKMVRLLFLAVGF